MSSLYHHKFHQNAGSTATASIMQDATVLFIMLVTSEYNVLSIDENIELIITKSYHLEGIFIMLINESASR